MSPFQTLVERTADQRTALHRLPVFADLAEGSFTVESYQAFLCNAYHHVRHTVPLMMACGARLPVRLSWLQGPLIEYINEEAGHEQWILNDLAATGADPEQVRHSTPSLEAELMVAYVHDFIERQSAVGFLGMVHVLEGTSTELAAAAADMVQSHLRLDDAAFSYLRSHGELDKEHVGFFEDLINRLDRPEDLDAIIHVATRVFHLYGQLLDSVPRSAQRHVA